MHPRMITIITHNVSIFHQQLVEGGAEAKNLLNKFDFYIIPVLNADGYVYTWTDVSIVIFLNKMIVIFAKSFNSLSFLPLLPPSLYTLDIKKCPYEDKIAS